MRSGDIYPVLSTAPSGAIDALEEKAKTDPATAAWVVDLDRFYQKQDAL